jgi:predicted SAM-dependent methyltransferase
MRYIKKLLPVWFKKILRKIIKIIKYRWRKVKIKKAVKENIPLKIILGAAETWQEGWYSTNEQWLDIANSGHWKEIFGEKKNVINIVTEHVFEHLTYDESKQTLLNIRQHMKADGRIRIAVPDGNNPNKEYIAQVGIAGKGPDAADHKQLLTESILSELFLETGFEPTLVEGYLPSGELIQKHWSDQDGFILRSRQNASSDVWDFIDSQTSLIVDGVLNET